MSDPFDLGGPRTFDFFDSVPAKPKKDKSSSLFDDDDVFDAINGKAPSQTTQHFMPVSQQELVFGKSTDPLHGLQFVPQINKDHYSQPSVGAPKP